MMPDWLFFVGYIQANCSDYCLRLWEVAGIWLAGFATTAAVVVSLMFSRRDRPRLTVSAGIRVILGGGNADVPSKVVAVTIRNKGNRPVKIEGVGWRSLVFRKYQAYQTFLPQPTDITLPYILAEGHSVKLFISLDDQKTDWAGTCARNFVGTWWPAMTVRFMRVVIWNPIGDRLEGRLEKDLRDRLVAESKKIGKEAHIAAGLVSDRLSCGLSVGQIWLNFYNFNVICRYSRARVSPGSSVLGVLARLN